MNKYTVLVVAIVGVVVLMVAGLATGHDGALLASSFTVIGALVGYAFGYLGTTPPAAKPHSRKFLGILLAAGCGLLAGCSGVAKIPVTVEVCIMDPEYGKICGSYVNGEIKISADVELPHDVEARIRERIRQLAGTK